MHYYYSLLAILFIPLASQAQRQAVGAEKTQTSVGFRFFGHSGHPEAGRLQSMNLHICRYTASKPYCKPSATIGRALYLGNSLYEPMTQQHSLVFGTVGVTIGWDGKYLGFKFSNEIGAHYDLFNHSITSLSNHTLAVNTGQLLGPMSISIGLPASLSFNSYVRGIVPLNVGIYCRF